MWRPRLGSKRRWPGTVVAVLAPAAGRAGGRAASPSRQGRRGLARLAPSALEASPRPFPPPAPSPPGTRRRHGRAAGGWARGRLARGSRPQTVQAGQLLLARVNASLLAQCASEQNSHAQAQVALITHRAALAALSPALPGIRGDAVALVNAAQGASRLKRGEAMPLVHGAGTPPVQRLAAVADQVSAGSPARIQQPTRRDVSTAPLLGPAAPRACSTPPAPA